MLYHKIQSIFKRDMSSPNNSFIIGDYTIPEFEFLKDNNWVWTEKIDGTNIRIMWDGESVTFGGRTDNAQMPIFLLYKLQELFEGTEKRKLFKDIFSKDGVCFTNICLYGEGYGAKIQKGGGNYIADGVDFILFDIKIGDIWLKREDVEDIAAKLGIRTVNIVGEGTVNEAIEFVKKGFNSEFGDFLAEGLVIRPEIELLSRNGSRIITKIKHRDFT